MSRRDQFHVQADRDLFRCGRRFASRRRRWFLQLQLESVLELTDRGVVLIEPRLVGGAEVRSKPLRCSPTADSTLLRAMILGSGVKLGEFGSWNSEPENLVIELDRGDFRRIDGIRAQEAIAVTWSPVAARLIERKRVPPPIASAIATSRL